MKLVSWLVNLLTLLLWECLDANRLIFSLSISHSFQPLDSRSRAQSRCQLLMCCVLRFFLSTSAHIKLTARHYVCWTLLLGFIVLLTWLLPRMAYKFVPLLACYTSQFRLIEGFLLFWPFWSSNILCMWKSPDFFNFWTISTHNRYFFCFECF